MLSSDEKQALIGLLGKVDTRQPYGTELFDALAKVTLSVAVEAVCLRIEDWSTPDLCEQLQSRQVQVYLTKRSENETAYPGEWHCPGSVMRPDEEVKDVFGRLSVREFGVNLRSWKFIGNVNHPTEPRGHFLSLVYLCELGDDKNQNGSWFPVHRLPEKTILTHRVRIIPAAVGTFVADNDRMCI